jgi:hypothetical protein
MPEKETEIRKKSPNKVLRVALRKLLEEIYNRNVLVKHAVDIDEIENVDKYEARLASAHSVKILASILYEIRKEKITLDTTFYNEVLEKLSALKQWPLCRALYLFMLNHALIDDRSQTVMFELAVENSPCDFALAMYVDACVKGKANIILHSRMINLVEKVKDINLANQIFKYAFNTPDAVRNNFGNTTISHDAHRRMMKVARALDDLDLARQIYMVAGDHQRQDKYLHEAMMDFLLARGYFKAAVQIYRNQNYSLKTQTSANGTLIVDLSDDSYGTAYIGIRDLLLQTVEDKKFLVVPPTAMVKELFLNIENIHQLYSIYFKVDISNENVIKVDFSPRVLRAPAKPFVPGSVSTSTMFKAERPIPSDKTHVVKPKHSKIGRR